MPSALYALFPQSFPAAFEVLVIIHLTDKKTVLDWLDQSHTAHCDRTGTQPMSPDLPVQSSSYYFKTLCQKSEDIGAAVTSGKWRNQALHSCTQSRHYQLIAAVVPVEFKAALETQGSHNQSRVGTKDKNHRNALFPILLCSWVLITRVWRTRDTSVLLVTRVNMSQLGDELGPIVSKPGCYGTLGCYITKMNYSFFLKD